MPDEIFTSVSLYRFSAAGLEASLYHYCEALHAKEITAGVARRIFMPRLDWRVSPWRLVMRPEAGGIRWVRWFGGRFLRKGISRCGHGRRILWLGHLRCGGEGERVVLSRAGVGMTERLLDLWPVYLGCYVFN